MPPPKAWRKNKASNFTSAKATISNAIQGVKEGLKRLGSPRKTPSKRPRVQPEGQENEDILEGALSAMSSVEATGDSALLATPKKSSRAHSESPSPRKRLFGLIDIKNSVPAIAHRRFTTLSAPADVFFASPAPVAPPTRTFALNTPVSLHRHRTTVQEVVDDDSASVRRFAPARDFVINEPDFANVPSLLETSMEEYGISVLFLPKFHCELNPIEQCWGYAKRIYRLNPESSKEDRLEQNAIDALDQVPLLSIRRFFNRAHRFMDAYSEGLNGRQSAWACRKYKGHRTLPPELKVALEKAGMSS